MIILAHRGLEPSNLDFYPESSYEAFQDHLKRGFGIEFDVNSVKDGIIIFHDSDLKRITKDKDNRYFSELTLDELKKFRYGENKIGRFSTYDELMNLIRNSKSELNALHFKGKYQTQPYIDLLIKKFKQNLDILNKILIFDVKPEVAKYMKNRIKKLILALSVAHSYDILRYNKYVEETLFLLEEAIKYKQKGIYDWVWLDEWDRLDKNGEKKFYTKENFEKLRNVGYKIALITPELHRTSPGLYRGESHKDAENKERLFIRIKEIINLKPDAVCTDYPAETKKIYEETKV